MTMRLLLAAVPLLLVLASYPVTSPTASTPLPISNLEFEELSTRLSERQGYFGTDNLVSNEASYLHVRQNIEELTEPDQAYVGVGPDQNFHYIAFSRPSIAFILDIRRDNLLHHLYYKAIFLKSKDRYDFCSFLFGKPLTGILRSAETNAVELLEAMKPIPSSSAFFLENFEELWRLMRQRHPNLVLESDREKVLTIASTFFRNGFDIRYEIPGRPMLSFFPSYGYLMTETDLDGNLGHYLNTSDSFLFLKQLQENNRLIPVVGNFSGPKALRAVGDEIRSRGLTVSMFYLSNVEFYLFRSRIYQRFVDNVSNLPISDNSLFVRSYFNNWFGTWRTHPHAQLNYFSTSLAQKISRFLELNERSPFLEYFDMVTRDYIGAPARPASVL